MTIRLWSLNLWDNSANVLTPSSEHPNFLAVNTQHRWKTKPWRSNYETLSDGTKKSRGNFTIDADNQEIYFNEGGGNLNATLTPGNYNPGTLATEIELQLEAAGAHSYTVEYLDTNYFKITDDTGTVNLLLSNQTDAVWDSIGWTTIIDTGLLASHTAEEIRIHTNEYIRVDFSAIASLYGIFLYGHNLSSAATAQLITSDDAWASILMSTSLASGSKCWALIPAVSSQRYQGINIIDRMNPDFYIEIGRVWTGAYFEPRIGFSPSRSINPMDGSLVSESEGGQASTIQRTKYKKWNYSFELADPKASFDTIHSRCGLSMPLIIQEKPTNNESSAFSNPEDNSYYARFTSWSYKHIAGQLWSLRTSQKEER